MEQATLENRNSTVLLNGIAETLRRGKISPEHANEMFTRAGVGPAEARKLVQQAQTQPGRPASRATPATALQQTANRERARYVEALRKIDLKPKVAITAPPMTISEKLRYVDSLRRAV